MNDQLSFLLNVMKEQAGAEMKGAEELCESIERYILEAPYSETGYYLRLLLKKDVLLQEEGGGDGPTFTIAELLEKSGSLVRECYKLLVKWNKEDAYVTECARVWWTSLIGRKSNEILSDKERLLFLREIFVAMRL